MKLIQAIAKSAPRLVNTRYGQKTVIDAISNDGQEITIWRSADDTASRSITNGSRIAVGLDSNGKYSLMETPADRASASRSEISPIVTGQTIRPMGFSIALPMEAESKLRMQIGAIKSQPIPASTSPVTALGVLFQECLTIAGQLVSEGDRVRVALALFDRLPQG